MWEMLVVGVLLGFVAGFAVVSRRSRSTFLALAEYWVYLPTTEVPTQEAVMDRMLRANPYRLRGQSPIGHNEGLIFSDIRLHIAVVRRNKNPHAFRPDLFESFIEPTSGQLATLSDSVALVKIRYASEEPLKDRRHLRFLAHAADAYAEFAPSTLIFDGSSAQLLDRAELVEKLTANPDGTQFELHVRFAWVQTSTDPTLETRGFQKVGMFDLRTQPVPADERVIVAQLFEEIARKVWESEDTKSAVQVEAYGDTFLGNLAENAREKRTVVRIMRMQNA